MTLIKKHFLIAFALVVAFGLLSFLPKNIVVVKAQQTTHQLKGWGWSSNIGWISLSSANPEAGSGGAYNVTLSDSGAFDGWAWSSNIGWIKFAGDGTSAHPNPVVNLNTGDVTGWVRACAGTVNKDCTGASRTDGWDGWIHLSDPIGHPTRNNNGTQGITFNPTTGVFNGYAWGSDVVGWLTFGTQIPPHCSPGVDCPPTGGNPITAVCTVPSAVTIPSGQTSTTVTPTVGSYANGTAPYTFSPSSFSLTEGTHALSINIHDSSNPQKTAQVSCGMTVVSSDDGEQPGIKMWIQKNTNLNDKTLTTIKIRVGKDATIKWEGVAGTTYDAGSCNATLRNQNTSSQTAPVLGSGVTTITKPAIGVYRYTMSCLSDIDSTEINAKNSAGGSYLEIIVTDSVIEEI